MHVVELVAADANVLDDIKFFETGGDALAFVLQIMMSSKYDTEVSEENNCLFFTRIEDRRVVCAIFYKAVIEKVEGIEALQSRLAEQMLGSEDPVLAINTFLCHIRAQLGHA